MRVRVLHNHMRPREWPVSKKLFQPCCVTRVGCDMKQNAAGRRDDYLLAVGILSDNGSLGRVMPMFLLTQIMHTGLPSETGSKERGNKTQTYVK